MTDELKTRIKEIAEKFPRIESFLKSATGGNGTPFIEDIKYLETEKYKVAAIKFEEHSWSGSSGVQWDNWASAYINKKGEEDVKIYETQTVITRDRYSASSDRRDLWSYTNVSLEQKSEDVFEFAWMNDEGHKLFKEIN